MKSQTLSKYFQVVHPEYVYLKIVPDISIRNYNSSSIAKSFHHMGRLIKDRISIQEKKFIYKSPQKAMYIIDINKYGVDFILVVPKQYSNLAREKIREVWTKVKIIEVEKLKPFSVNSKKYCLYYKKEDALSLDIDKKNNEPLNHILNVIEIMDDTDRITLVYNFMPILSQYSWEAEYQSTIDKLEQGFTVNKSALLLNILSKIGYLVNYVLDTFFNAFSSMFGKDDYTSDILTNVKNMLGLVNNRNNISLATRKKRNDIVINTQLLLVSSGNNSEVNASTIAQTYKSIEDDNSLIYKPVKKIKDIRNYDFHIKTNKMSIAECQNLIQIPGNALLSEFKNIEKIDTNESQVPEQISVGIIRVGDNEFRGKKTKVHHTEDPELKNTAVCICGGNRSGKSTLIANNTYDMIKDGRTVIVPDFCGKCQLSDELSKVIPKSKILNIDCSDLKNIQGFGYNEIVPKDDSIFELYSCAKMKASKLKELINLINEDTVELEGRMERYLEFAALIVFISNGSVNDVFRVLKNHKLRHEYINKIPLELKDNLQEYVEELLEIDEVSKGEVTGTKQGHVTAILSRIHRLKSNSYIEEMLKKDCSNNINLIDEMQQGKLILLRMYDNMFSTQLEKDIYVCYWLTKIWGALQKRFCDIDKDKLIQSVMVIDELYQTKNAEKYLTMILSQMPKYKTKLILSCHHLAQIPVIQEELKSALCSYIFIQSSNKKNYYAMKEEFEDKGFCLDDLLHLKRYQALCLITYEEGYWAGIVQLPKPI